MSTPKAVSPGSDTNRLDDRLWLSARRSERWSVTRIAAELGVDHRVVSAALRRADLPVPLPVVLTFPQLHDVEWLTRALGRQCVEDVARTIGCTPQSVRYAARKYDVSVMINGHDLPPATAAMLDDGEWMSRRRREGATLRELAAELGVTVGRVAAASRRVGAPPVRRNGSRPTFPQLYNAEWVRSELATKSRTQVARELDCSVRSVRDAAARAGVPPSR